MAFFSFFPFSFKSNFSGLVVSCEKTVLSGGEPLSRYPYHNEKKYENLRILPDYCDGVRMSK